MRPSVISSHLANYLLQLAIRRVSNLGTAGWFMSLEVGYVTNVK